MKQIIDPVFGLLTLQSDESADVWWKKQEHLELTGGPVRLEIRADTSGPTEKQRQVYLTFRQAEKYLKAELQEALFKFYQIEQEIYTDIYAEICDDSSLGLREEDFVPVLERHDQIWGLLSPLAWLILDAERANWKLKDIGLECDTLLSWHGSWDVEHEFSALFYHGRFLGIEHLRCFYGHLDLQPSSQ